MNEVKRGSSSQATQTYCSTRQLTSCTDVFKKWAFEKLNQKRWDSQLKGAGTLVLCLLASGPEAFIRLTGNVYKATQDNTFLHCMNYSHSVSKHHQRTDDDEAAPFTSQELNQRMYIVGGVYIAGLLGSQLACSIYGPLGFIGATISYVGYQLALAKTGVPPRSA